MKTIAFVSQKGGVGKTTLASHIAVKLSKDFNVGVIDLDPQGSITEWQKARNEQHQLEEPYLIPVRESLTETLSSCEKGGFDFIIIDSAPNEINNKDYITEADMILIPVKASPHDLRTISKTWSLIEEKEKAYFILNDIKERTRIAFDTLRTLSGFGEVAATITSRVSFSESQIDGRTIQELEPNGKGANEINQIYNFIIKKLKPKTELKAAA